jgi:Spy/CpxP family protein refolding chaperone
MKRTLLAVAATVIMTATLFAQNTPAGPPRGQRQNPLTGLKNALGLTDAQVQAITSLIQTEKTRIQALMSDVQQKRQALNSLLNASSPNPPDVGNAAIALNASEKKLPPERDYFISQLKTLLTGDQQQKLDTLLAANGGRIIPFPGFGGPGFRGRGGPLN